ncbi:mitogen-activated protein kinase kinase kinase 5 isoform X2 [Malania oleifera]|uniref:mitogen-activated protein kinase kinase kinase 5 isoform X2 n=1 Tax=Malania oleifera TaxID=397392 RepID=UPI0025ADB781|nr:mitogen-activated protein kinase kinase kinase 5 isoform X2 [Malania oleifera]
MPWWPSSPSAFSKLSPEAPSKKKKSSSSSVASSSSPTASSASGAHRRGLRRFAGQSNPRNLPDLDVGIASSHFPSLEASPDTTPLSRSPSNLEFSSARVSPGVPQPLPLPEHSQPSRREGVLSPNSCSANCPLPSPKEAPIRGLEDRDRDRDRERGDASTGDGNGRFSYQDAQKSTEHIKSPRNGPQDLKSEGSHEKFRINVPVQSAPTSPFSSPMRSPQRITTGDIFQSHYMALQGLHVWSAPEMPVLDMVLGFPSYASPDRTTFSVDSSPLHSPSVRSPRQNLRSPSGPTSPLHPKLSLETAAARRENNGHVNVHPLPLPPMAALPSQATPIPQVTCKPEVLPMTLQWQKGKLIGRGTFGSVYVATNRETGALCAMKEVEIFPDDPKSGESIKQLQQEIKVLSQLKHPNIVQYYGSEIYVYPGSINRYVREHCGAITESVVRNFTRHILSGLAYLHGTKTIHRDIKGANLLVDASGVVKLADFGMAKHLSGQAADLSLKGSPYWMAPEVLQAVMQKDNNSDLAFAVDIWSLGCTIIEMLNGKPPWSEYEGAAAMFKVLRETPPIPETLSPEGKDFLRCCFRRNPAERPSANKLLEHLFLRSSQLTDVPTCTQSFNGMKLMDDAHSQRQQSNFKSSQSMSSSTKSAKGKVGSKSFSFMRYSFNPVRLGNNRELKLPT